MKKINITKHQFIHILINGDNVSFSSIWFVSYLILLWLMSEQCLISLLLGWFEHTAFFLSLFCPIFHTPMSSLVAPTFSSVVGTRNDPNIVSSFDSIQFCLWLLSIFLKQADLHMFQELKIWFDRQFPFPLERAETFGNARLLKWQ